MPVEPTNVDLSGLIDMHIHTAPDVRPRRVDDIEAAQQAADAGMRAVVFKSHVTCTADRAAIAQKVVPGVRVFGSVTLNEAVGGLNPAAVDAALELGARVVWMPTISAQNHIVKHGGASAGINLLGNRGFSENLVSDPLQPSLYDILDLVKQRDAVLATGHVSVREIVALVRAARAAGVRKVVVTHPEVPWVDMPAGTQEELRDLGAIFERCYVSSLPAGGGVSFARIVSNIRRVGVTSTALATDFGVATLPPPVAGMRSYVAMLLAEGFSRQDVQVMAGDIPARLLGL
jgi:hypothetical protein